MPNMLTALTSNEVSQEIFFNLRHKDCFVFKYNVFEAQEDIYEVKQDVETLNEK